MTTHKGSGWIGYWSPGIGDPSVVGWVTVALYALAAILCFRCASWVKARADVVGRKLEVLLWRITAVTLCFLCINKQLDLQTAMTEFGRIVAYQQGWYAVRFKVQKAFIAVFALSGFLVLSWLLAATWHLSRSLKLAIIGLCFIGVFVLIRASSFHHVDVFLGKRFFDAKWNWILEIGGISVVTVAACARLLSQKTRIRAE